MIGFLVLSRESETKPVKDVPLETPRLEQEQVTLPDIQFFDVTTKAGVDFVHENGATGERLLPETMGGGVALFDYDNDTDLDLLFVNSTTWGNASPTGDEPARSRIYANDGAGRFTDITAHTLDLVTYGMAPAVGDVDGDGFPDLFVTAVGKNVLLRNHAGKYFADETDQWGVAGDSAAFSSCATFLDYDRDGDLDLFVCNYVKWSEDIDKDVDFRLTGVGRAYGPPTDFPGSNSWLYRNDGSRFTDVTSASGIEVMHSQTGLPVGKALAVSPFDINGDAYVDLIVANDTVRNFAFINKQDGTFEERGISLGLAFDASGEATGAMGIDVAHYANDERVAIAIGNFANEMSSFYIGTPSHPTFSDDAIVAGIGAPTRKVLTFGVFFFDADLDGRQDFFGINGHIEPEITLVQSSQQYRQRPQLFWNCGERCRNPFQEIPSQDSSAFEKLVGRGAAFGDIDADGDLDLVLTEVGGHARILENRLASDHDWLAVNLQSRDGNPFGIGSTVTIETERSTQTQLLTRTRSYLTQVGATLHFGLGSNSKPRSIRVKWPNGVDEVFPYFQVNQSVTLIRDTGTVPQAN